MSSSAKKSIKEAIKNKTTSLSISGCEVKSISSDIKKLALISLNASVNLISDVPPWLGSMLTLQDIDLSSNKIKDLPLTIFNLSNLRCVALCCSVLSCRVLNLTSNRLESIPPCIFKLTNLRELYLNNNSISIIQTEIADLLNLEVFQARGNALQYIPKSAGQLTKLKILYLSDNRLGALPDLRDCRDLVDLDVHNNELTSLPDMFGKMYLLETLNISYNKITTLPDTLGKCRSLKSFQINNNLLNVSLYTRGDVYNVDAQEIVKKIASNAKISLVRGISKTWRMDGGGNASQSSVVGISRGHSGVLSDESRQTTPRSARNEIDNDVRVMAARGDECSAGKHIGMVKYRTTYEPMVAPWADNDNDDDDDVIIAHDSNTAPPPLPSPPSRSNDTSLPPLPPLPVPIIDELPPLPAPPLPAPPLPAPPVPEIAREESTPSPCEIDDQVGALGDVASRTAPQRRPGSERSRSAQKRDSMSYYSTGDVIAIDAALADVQQLMETIQ